MSGGSFDYLYSKFQNEDALSPYSLELLESMADWLAEPEQAQPAAADELRRIHGELLQLQTRIHRITYYMPFLDLLKAGEWWCSHDTDYTDFEEAWHNYTVAKRPPILSYYITTGDDEDTWHLDIDIDPETHLTSISQRVINSSEECTAEGNIFLTPEEASALLFILQENLRP